MTDGSTKKIIVVLSAGRSGTSLLMNVLGQLGMSLSENLISGRLENPEGYFEDAEIVQIHNQLLLDLKTKPTLPLPDDWRESNATREARQKLRLVLAERIKSAKTLWGFKDPRVCSFMPLWTHIFNLAGVVPTFILAVRNPASVVMSLHRQINREESITELQWLQRNCDAINHTAADCFIVHYEEWFTHPQELVHSLLDYTGLSEFAGGKDIDQVLNEVIKPNLNRAQYEDYAIRNQSAAKLYAQLQQCHGSDFDRKTLMEVVKECQDAMEQFRGWADVARADEARIVMLEKRIERAKLEVGEARAEAVSKEKQLSDNLTSALAEVASKEKALCDDIKKARAEAITLQKESEKELSKALAENNKLLHHTKDLESELEKAVLENNKLLQQVKDLFEEVKNLRRSVNTVNNSLSGKMSAPKPLRRRGKQRVATPVGNASSARLREYILFAKRRVASLSPGFYRFYKSLKNSIRP
jgi:hypothetical protein